MSNPTSWTPYSQAAFTETELLAYYNPVTNTGSYVQGSAGGANVNLYAWSSTLMQPVMLTVNSSGQLNVTGGGSTSTGCNVDREVSLSNSPILIKGSSGNFYGYNYFNPGTSLAYVHLYDAASAAAVTVGTTVPTLSFPLPSNTNAQVGDETINSAPIYSFQNGLVIASSTTPNGGSAPGSPLFAQTYYV